MQLGLACAIVAMALTSVSRLFIFFVWFSTFKMSNYRTAAEYVDSMMHGTSKVVLDERDVQHHYDQWGVSVCQGQGHG